MARRLKALIAAALGATVLTVPAAAQADTGTISGATINPEGTLVSVSNMTVVIDNCPFFDPLAGNSGCGAEAGVVPAFSVCPSGGVGIQSLWSALRAGTVGSRTMSSGARSVAVSSPVAYRVCLYGVHFSQNYGEVYRLRAEALTPTPIPPKQGTEGKTGKGKKCKKKGKARAAKKCRKKAK